jgi:hypothetical protein
MNILFTTANKYSINLHTGQVAPERNVNPINTTVTPLNKAQPWRLFKAHINLWAFLHSKAQIQGHRHFSVLILERY